MANPFIHIELASTDVAKAKDFYGKLFDWQLRDEEMGPGMTYTMVNVGDDGTGGGMMQHPVPGAPSAWLPYVQVADLDAATKKAAALGAKIMREKTEIPEMGSFSIIIDPTGAALGLWQNAT